MLFDTIIENGFSYMLLYISRLFAYSFSNVLKSGGYLHVHVEYESF